MSKTLEIVLGNLLTIGILIAIAATVKLEVKTELFLNGMKNTTYNLKIF
jgi:hypothetical protein